MAAPILLLDGHSLAYRAFYALPDTIQTSAGQPTNAVYGFLSMLVKLLTEHPTDRIGVAFDRGRPTVRLEVFTEYKAQREETPHAFRGQVELIEQCLAAMGIPVFGIIGHEADDLLATLTRQARAAGDEVLLVTADRDYLQLVQPGVTVLFNRKGVSDYTLFDAAEVEAKYGLPPERYIDLAALRGDPSDNLPGVAGIGDKTATTLIQTFGSVEVMLDKLDELPKKFQRFAEPLAEARTQILRNKQLIRLVDDLELEVTIEDVRRGPWDEEEVRRLFGALQFRALLERIADIRPASEVESSSVIVGSGSAHDLAPADAGSAIGIAWLEGADGLALARPGEEPVWFAHVREASTLLTDPDARIVTHDAKSLLVRAWRDGIDAQLPVSDTQLAAYLLDPAAGRYPLDELSVRYLRRHLPDAATSDEPGGQLGFGFDDTTNAESAGARAAVLAPLAERLEADLAACGMLELYRDIELPLARVLARMEEHGVAIDADLLRARSATVTARIHEIETAVAEINGGPINLNSTPQLRALLYERLELKPSRRTKTGYSTDAATLETLKGQHPVIELMLEHRILEKLRSTYLDALPAMIDPRTGRIHAHFNQTSVATGRIGSESPNLQNIPIRTELGREIREAFIAGIDDGMLVVADYSQIELRVLAHITGDPGLVAAFERGDDIHAATAATIWRMDVADVPKDLRNRAKAINFGLAYGMNRYGLAQKLGVEPDVAQGFVDGYFASFPLVRDFMHEVVEQAKRDGYTTTMLGRRRYIPELQHANPQVRAMGERQALNAPIQGSAADILKLAMLKVDAGLIERGLDARIVLTVHDELVLEARAADAEVTMEAVRSLMEQAHPMRVQLVVDARCARTWAEAKT